MIANKGSDPQSAGKPDSAGKVPPLNKDTDMVIFELFLSGYCSTFNYGTKCLTPDWSNIPEEVKAKAKRFKDLAVTNGRVNGAMYQACAEVIAVLVQHALEDPLEKNAFILFEMLKKKFTKKTDERFQALINQLNTLAEAVAVLDQQKEMYGLPDLSTSEAAQRCRETKHAAERKTLRPGT